MDDKKFKKYYASGPHFRIENPNPVWQEKKGFIWDRSDCVIRAVANALSVSWLRSFDYLTEKARAEYNVPNDGKGLRRWLVQDGATWEHYKAVKGKKRTTVMQFAETHPTGRYIISIAHHETAVVDGVILDAYNCGEHAIVGVFDMANFQFPAPQKLPTVRIIL